MNARVLVGVDAAREGDERAKLSCKFSNHGFLVISKSCIEITLIIL